MESAGARAEPSAWILNPSGAVANGERRRSATLGRRYRLEHEIAEGGSAVIWRATDSVLGRPVAVKRPRDGHDPHVRERFLREARVMAAVRHRSVVGVLDVGEDDHGPYLVMELLPGRPLSDHFAGTPPILDVVAVVSGVLSGVSAIHDVGLVHGDLKPENVLLVPTDDGGWLPVIVDFGIARVLRAGGDLRSVHTTEDGVVHGTPQFMAPEQARGAPVDPRTDVFTVGILLFELLTGSLPFDEDTSLRTLIAVATRPTPPVRSRRSDIPEGLATVVDRALAKHPEDRFQSAIEFRRELLRSVGHDPDARSALATTYEPGDSGMFEVPELRVTPRPPVGPPAEPMARPPTPTPDPPVGPPAPVARIHAGAGRLVAAFTFGAAVAVLACSLRSLLAP